MVQLSHPYMTIGKTIAFTIWTFVGKMISLLFNTLSRFDSIKKMIPNFIKYLLFYYFLTFPGITFPNVNEFTCFTHFPTGQFIHK